MIQIKCRFTAKVLLEGDYPTIKVALEAAIKYGATLAGANLARADLAGADIARANLAGAYLAGATLAGANLAGAKVLYFAFNKHTAYATLNGEITIGCHKKSVAEWVEKYAEIGAHEKYTQDEIEAYGTFIKLVAQLENNK